MRRQGKYQGIYFYLHVFVLFGFLTAGLFPQCAQSNPSKNYIEICTINGIELVALDSAPDEGKQAPKPRKPCPYCFAAHMDRIAPDAPAYSLSLDSIAETTQFPAVHTIRLPSRPERYEARGPPYAV